MLGIFLCHSGSYPVLVPLMADASIQGEEKGHSYIKRRVATTQYNARAFLLPPLLPSYQGWKRRQGHYPCLHCVHIPMYIAYGASCIVEMGPNAALDHANISTFWITTTRNYLFLQYSLLSVCSLGISFRSLPSFLSSHLHQTDFAFFPLSLPTPLFPPSRLSSPFRTSNFVPVSPVWARGSPRVNKCSLEILTQLRQHGWFFMTFHVPR